MLSIYSSPLFLILQESTVLITGIRALALVVMAIVAAVIVVVAIGSFTHNKQKMIINQ